MPFVAYFGVPDQVRLCGLRLMSLILHIRQLQVVSLCIQNFVHHVNANHFRVLQGTISYCIHFFLIMPVCLA